MYGWNQPKERILNALFTLPGCEEFKNDYESGTYILKRTGDHAYVLSIGALGGMQIEMRFEERTRMHTRPYYVNPGAATMREYYENLENERYYASYPPMTYEVHEIYGFIGKNEVCINSEGEFPAEIAVYNLKTAEDSEGTQKFTFSMDIICSKQPTKGEAWLSRYPSPTREQGSCYYPVTFDFTADCSGDRYRFKQYGKIYDSEDGEIKED